MKNLLVTVFEIHSISRFTVTNSFRLSKKKNKNQTESFDFERFLRKVGVRILYRTNCKYSISARRSLTPYIRATLD